MQSAAPAPRTVHKFGGASLADGARIRRVGELLVERAPDRPIVVVSAVEGVTAKLDELAHEAARGGGDLAPVRVRHRSLLAQLDLEAEHLNRHFAELSTVLAAIRSAGALSRAHRDHVLSFGERASARIVAAHLSSRGLRAVPIDAYDLGLVTDSNHGSARVLPHSAERIRSALERIDALCVITGFVAADSHGRLTTLGRNGSDVSAALIGEAVRAREVVFWKEVDGVMSADPRLVPDARSIEKLSYEQASWLTRHGAGVLHSEAVEVLQRSSVAGRVRCTRTPREPGTLVSNTECEHPFVGMASRSGLTFAQVSGLDAQESTQLLDSLRAASVAPITHVVTDDGLQLLAPASAELDEELGALDGRAELVRGVASLDVLARRSVDELIDEQLEQAGVEVLARMRSSAARTLVLSQGRLALAAVAVHAALAAIERERGGAR